MKTKNINFILLYQFILVFLIYFINNDIYNNLSYFKNVLHIKLFFIITYFFIIILTSLLFKIKKRNIYCKIQMKDLFKLLIFLLISVFLFEFLFYSFYYKNFSFKIDIHLLGNWYFVFLSIFLIPIFQEVVFRELIIAEKTNYVQIIISNLIFSFFFFPNVKLMFSGFLYGILMLAIIKKYKSLIINIIFSILFYLMTSILIIQCPCY